MQPTWSVITKVTPAVRGGSTSCHSRSLQKTSLTNKQRRQRGTAKGGRCEAGADRSLSVVSHAFRRSRSAPASRFDIASSTDRSAKQRAYNDEDNTFVIYHRASLTAQWSMMMMMMIIITIIVKPERMRPLGRLRR